MKHKFSLIWRVAVALVLVLSFSLVAAVPVAASPSVSDVSVELYKAASSDAYKKAEAGVTYYIYFTPGVALTANVDTITVRFPAGTSGFAWANTWVDPDGDSAHYGETRCTLGMVAGYNLQVTTPVSISAGTEAYLKVTNITNPTWTAPPTTKAHTLVLYTSQETTEITSAAYTLGTGTAITTVEAVTVDPADVSGTTPSAAAGTAGAADDWLVTFTITTALVDNWDTITVTFPPDVYVPSPISKSYILVDPDDDGNFDDGIPLEEAPTIVGQSVSFEVPGSAAFANGTAKVWFKAAAGIKNPTLATNTDPPNHLVHKGSYIGKVKTSKDSGIMRDADGFGVVVNGASPSVLGIKVGSPTQVLAGIASTNITVQSKDVYGNLSKPAGAVSVTLASSSTTALFDGQDTGGASLDGDFNDTITVIAGGSSAYEAIFQYKDSVVGTATITASFTAMGWTPATWGIEVMAANEVYLYHGTSLIGTYGTITAALSFAMPGQTVKVTAGTYSVASGETFPITLSTSSVTLESIDGAASTTIDASAATGKDVIRITSSAVNVVVGGSDCGFTIKGALTGAPDGGAIYLMACTTPTIQGNTIITSGRSPNPRGIYNPVGSNCSMTIKDNTITSAVPSSSVGMWLFPLANSVIDNNEVSDFGVGISLWGTSTSNSWVTPITVSNNTVHGSIYEGIGLDGSTGALDYVLVSGNDCYDNQNGIAMDGNSLNEIKVTGNNLYNNKGSGLRLFSAVAGNAAQVYVFGNNIYGNTTTLGYDLTDDYGILNSASGTVPAKHNWWGDASGPTVATNPGGTGDAVNATVTYRPWLTAPIVKGAAAFTHDTATLTGKTTAGVDVSGATGASDCFIGAARYTVNPRAAITEFTPLAESFFDVFVEETVTPPELITINFYPSGVTADSVAWYWSTAEGDWVKCSEQDYSALGFVWVKCRHEASVTPPATLPTAEGLAAGVQFVIGTEVPVRTLQSIAVTPATASIGVGGTKQFTATGTYNLAPLEEVITTEVTWASSNLSVATIDAAGLATGVAEGTTNITATLDTIVSTPAVLTVSEVDILAYYRAYSGDPEVVETTDLLKAANDWANEVVPPDFTECISTTQLLELANEWAATE